MKRSKHSLSHLVVSAGFVGQLYPVGCVEVLPGDTFQHASSVFVRCSPLNTPVMHPYTVRLHHWFVPIRLLWANFENFITGGPSGTDSTVLPYIPTGATRTVGDLADYLGLDPGSGTSVSNLSILPVRAVNLIWNEWYRDQDLQASLTLPTTDGSDTTSNMGILPVCYPKDYFTSARPWPQKGPDVLIPLSGQAPVYGIGKTNTQNFGNAGPSVWDSAFGSTTYPHAARPDWSTADNEWQIAGTAATGGIPNIQAQLQLTSGGADIAALREAAAIYRYEEARARYGSRYTEYLRYLGVRSSDARLQRPEFLGGGKGTIQFSEVLQTAVTTSGTPVTGVGALQGHGINATRTNRYRRFFEEHGFCISLLSVVPKNMYMSCNPRYYLYNSKTDFYQRELEGIGQQEITNAELGGNTVHPGNAFGYQDRYDQYRRIYSYVTGRMRTSLDIWHSARAFGGGSDPVLNNQFVQVADPNRIWQDSSDPTLQFMIMHSLQARRIVRKSGGQSFLF